MKILAILDVNEEKLRKTKHSFEEEMGWVEDSGITLGEYYEVETCGEYEYVMFAWNTKTERYEQIGKPTRHERLARERFYEYVQMSWFNPVYDTDKALMKRRMVFNVTEKWEECEVTENEK